MKCDEIRSRKGPNRRITHTVSKKSINDAEDNSLTRQIQEGKYGLIHTELFSKQIERPGIISYATNDELPHDNRVSLGGLKHNEIWFSKDDLLIIKGGSFPEEIAQKTVWSPISDYEAPKHEILLAENPEVPPPFPVQLYENGPVIYLKKNYSHNETKDDLKLPYLNENEINALKPIIPNLPPGAVFVPPSSNQSIEDEFNDDHSLYYPKSYSFVFKNRTKTLVEPGPLVPGIVLPPPPDFFGPLNPSTTTTTTARPQTTVATTTETLTQIYPTYYPTKLTSKFYDIVDNSIHETPLPLIPVTPTMKPIRNNQTTSFILTINDDIYDNPFTNLEARRPALSYPIENFIESTTRFFIKKRNYNNAMKLRPKIRQKPQPQPQPQQPITTYYLVNNNNENNNAVPFKNYYLVPLNNNFDFFKSNIDNLRAHISSYRNFDHLDAKPVYSYENTNNYNRNNNLKPNQLSYQQSLLSTQRNHFYERPYRTSTIRYDNTEQKYFEIFGKRLEPVIKKTNYNPYNDEIIKYKNSINRFEQQQQQRQQPHSLDPNLKPLHSDIDVNFKNPLPPINPDAELVDDSFQGTKISYQLPGNGAHVYFYTPYPKSKGFNVLQKRQNNIFRRRRQV